MVLDIDGVVKQGDRAVAGAAEALRKLQQQCVPFVFMTNGGLGRSKVDGIKSGKMW